MYTPEKMRTKCALNFSEKYYYKRKLWNRSIMSMILKHKIGSQNFIGYFMFHAWKKNRLWKLEKLKTEKKKNEKKMIIITERTL